MHRFSPTKERNYHQLFTNAIHQSLPLIPPQLPIQFNRTRSNNLVTNDGVRARSSNANGVVATGAGSASGCALLPCNMELLGESNRRVIVGQLTRSLAVLGGEGNTVVDVEDTVAAARRPDGSGCLNRVLLGVDLAVGESTAAGEGGAGGLLSSSLV
jgi:hypothetical protein